MPDDATESVATLATQSSRLQLSIICMPQYLGEGPLGHGLFWPKKNFFAIGKNKKTLFV